jgi:hypothetical protein
MVPASVSRVAASLPGTSCLMNAGGGPGPGYRLSHRHLPGGKRHRRILCHHVCCASLEATRVVVGEGSLHAALLDPWTRSVPQDPARGCFELTSALCCQGDFLPPAVTVTTINKAGAKTTARKPAGRITHLAHKICTNSYTDRPGSLSGSMADSGVGQFVRYCGS